MANNLIRFVGPSFKGEDPEEKRKKERKKEPWSILLTRRLPKTIRPRPLLSALLPAKHRSSVCIAAATKVACRPIAVQLSAIFPPRNDDMPTVEVAFPSSRCPGMTINVPLMTLSAAEVRPNRAVNPHLVTWGFYRSIPLRSKSPSAPPTSADAHSGDLRGCRFFIPAVLA